MKPLQRWFRTIPSLVLAFLVAGCSSDSGDITPPPQEGPPLTSGNVAVNRSSVLLTAIGQSRQLTAQTTDGSGGAVSAAVVWSSSAPDQVSIDAAGRVMARAIGSAQIFATSGGVRSPPVFVVVAEPHPGALLVNDAQVLSIGQPIGVAPGQIPGIGTRYEVRLTGITTTPSPGTVVLAAENATVAGKVVSTRNEAGAMVVTLALAPLSELLARYNIKWSIDLAALPGTGSLTGAGSAAANVSRAVTPRPPSTGAATSLLAPVTAFNCDASLNAVLLDRKVQLAPVIDMKFEVEDLPGRTRRAIVGTMKLVGSVSLKLNFGFKFKGECKFQLPITIPIGGWFSLVLAPAVRLGVGVSVEGQLAVTAGELSITGELGRNFEVGWECGGTTASCQTLETLTPADTMKPKMELLNPTTGLRLELQAQFFVLAGLDAVFLTALHGEVLEARAGPVQSFDLGFEEDQAENPSYASKYDLKLEAVIQPGSALQEVLDMIGKGITLTFQAKASEDLSESPKGPLTVSRTVVGLSGETVDFKVDLKHTEYFWTGYNVERVELWRKKATEGKFTPWKALDRTASNQTIFTYTWQPTPDDLGPNEFAAFVYTKILAPGLEVADNSVRTVDVKCFSAGPRVAARLVAAANTCADTWVGSSTLFVPGQYRFDASVTWNRDPARPEINGDVSYIATGTVTVKYIFWENQGCSVSKHIFDVAEFPEASSLLVEFGESPPKYIGSAQTLALPIVSCPGMAPFELNQLVIWFFGEGQLSGNGTVIEALKPLDSGGFWQWRFARP